MFHIVHKARALFAGLGALAMALGAVALTPLTGVQADGWCWGDPVLSINGSQVAVNVGAQGDFAFVHSHVQMATITVTIPRNVSASVVSMDPNSAIPETVVFVHSNYYVAPGHTFTAQISVTFTASQTIPAGMSVTYNGASTLLLADTSTGVSHRPRLH